jgi:hypothetical protein
VFVRRTKFLTVEVPKDFPLKEKPFKAGYVAPEVDIFGLFSGAWFLPPSHPLREAYKTVDGDTVPVGIGMVVPSERIIELMNLPELKGPRDEIVKARAAKPT